MESVFIIFIFFAWSIFRKSQSRSGVGVEDADRALLSLPEKGSPRDARTPGIFERIQQQRQAYPDRVIDAQAFPQIPTGDGAEYAFGARRFHKERSVNTEHGTGNWELGQR